MNNKQFLKLISKSFIRFLQTSSRSNEKLKILHGEIAKDLEKRLGKKYSIKSYGIGDGKEGFLLGRYINKQVDILISKDGEDMAGIGVKFVMNNYSQNSNNYFENMLGETANIRTNDKKYFQIFILPDEMPYYTNKGKIQKWEKITEKNINKYLTLSKDKVDSFLHTPDKTLLAVIKFPKCSKEEINTRKKYKDYYLGKNSLNINFSDSINEKFSSLVILNDYQLFINKIVYSIKSI